MSREYNAVLSTLFAELSRNAPRPSHVMASMAEIEAYGDAPNIRWQQLQQFEVVETLGTAISVVQGSPNGMVADARERFRLLRAYRGSNTTRGIYQQSMQRFPKEVRRRHLDNYGALIINGQWEDSDGDHYESEESSYHGDEGQEDHHFFMREEDAAEEENRDLVARIEYGNLIQFMGRTESGTRQLQAFRAHLGRELEQGNYPFSALDDEALAGLLR